MITIRGRATGGKITARPLSEIDFSITTQARNTIIDEGSTEENAIDDVVRTTYTGAAVLYEAQIGLTGLTIKHGVPSYESQDEDVATVDSNGNVTRVSDGTVRIIIRTDVLDKWVDVAVSQNTPSSTIENTRFVVGSLADNMCHQIDDRIAGKTPSTTKPIYTIQNHSGGVYVRNMNCWASDVDLTAISPWNSNAGNKKAGTLISPRHIVFANHYTYPNGTTIRFITNDNQIIERTLQSQTRIGSTDIQVGLLNSDVPGTITFAKTLPTNFTNYLASYSTGFAPYPLYVPIASVDQEEKLLVSNCARINSEIQITTPSNTTYSDRYDFYETIIVGDSGNPIFVLINNELVLLSCFETNLGGQSLTNNYTAINTAMTTLGGGYQLTDIDLISFPSYNN